MSNFRNILEPCDENIEKALSDDLLKNNKWINKCLNLLLDMDDSIIIFDGKWGSGKTFIAREIQKIINMQHDYEMNQIEPTKYPEISLNNKKNYSTYAIYYNAWEYDNDDNPMSSFLYYLTKELHIKIGNNDFDNYIKNFIVNLVEKLSDGYIKFSKAGKENTLKEVLDSVITSEYIRMQIDDFLQKIKSEWCNNLVIIIDELDRCRPTYALRLIEMINLYLKREGILVLCFSDLNQLCNTISTYYGNRDNAYLYLDKFFDLKIELPSYEVNKNYLTYKYLDVFCNNTISYLIFDELVTMKNLTLRNIDKLIAHIKPFYKYNSLKSGETYENTDFILQVFIPYYYMAKLFDIDEYENIIRKDFSKMIDFCSRISIKDYINQMFKDPNKYENESYEVHLRDILSDIISYITNESDWTPYLQDKLKCKYSIANVLERISLLDSISDSLCKDKNKK